MSDNALSAVAKICCAYANELDFSSILPLWCSGLPAVHDLEEAPSIYGFLLKGMVLYPRLVFGSSNEHAPDVVASTFEFLTKTHSPEAIYNEHLGLDLSRAIVKACAERIEANNSRIDPEHCAFFAACHANLSSIAS